MNFFVKSKEQHKIKLDVIDVLNTVNCEVFCAFDMLQNSDRFLEWFDLPIDP